MRGALAFLAGAIPGKAARPYLPRSFPTTRPGDLCYTYDAALCIVLWSRLAPRRARAALHTLREVNAEYRGDLPFALGTFGSERDERRSYSGTIAWVGYAACAYEALTGDTQYRGFAMDLAERLAHRAGDAGESGLVPVDAGHAAISTEHNIDYYFFLRALEKLGVTTYANDRESLAATLFSRLYDATNGHFRRGARDDADVLDCASWGAILALDVMGAHSSQYAACLHHAFDRFWNDDPPGFRPSPYEKTTWIEGTLGVICALALGRQAGASILPGRESALTAAIRKQAVPTKIGTGWPYARPEIANFPNSPAIASTAWWVVATLVRTGDAPFLRAFWAG